MENIYIIDYTRPDGRKDFKCVEAGSPERAAEIFRNAGIDGWSGYNFKEYQITNISRR